MKKQLVDSKGYFDSSNQSDFNKSRNALAEFVDMEYINDDYDNNPDIFYSSEIYSEGFYDWFIKHHDGVVGYHGCRPSNISSYLHKGILVSNPSAIEKDAKTIFKEVHESRFDEIFQYMKGYSQGLNKGRVFLCADRRQLLEECGHYLIYGCEYLSGIANHIDGGGWGVGLAQEKLRDQGFPLLFKVNIDFENLSRGCIIKYINSLISVLRNEYKKRTIHSHTFILNKSVSRQKIAGYEIPRKIFDPINCEDYFFDYKKLDSFTDSEISGIESL